MKIIDLKQFPKCKYYCTFNYSLINESIDIDSFLKKEGFQKEMCALIEKKDYLIFNDENLILLLNEIYTKIIYENLDNYESINTDIKNILDELEEKGFSIKNDYYINLEGHKKHEFLKSYFMSIINIEKTCDKEELDLTCIFDFDEKNLPSYYINTYITMNYIIYSINDGLYCLKYNLYIDNTLHFKNIYYLDMLENLCKGKLKEEDKNNYLSYMGKNKSFCLDIFDFNYDNNEFFNNCIYIRSYVLNICRLSNHRYKLIPHLIRASINRRIKTYFDNQFDNIHEHIRFEIFKYVQYEAKEKITYKDLINEEKKYIDNNEYEGNV